VIDLDEALRDYATRWKADQPVAPDLDEVLDCARTRRTSHRWSLVLAAACVVALAVAAVSFAVGRSAEAPSAGSTSQAPHPPSAAQRARLERIAFRAAVSGGDPLASADAVRTTVRRAAALLDGKQDPNVTDGPIWFVQLHGHQLDYAGSDGGTPGSSRGPFVYFTVPIGVVDTGFSGTGHRGYDLTHLGTVIHLLTHNRTAAQLAHVRAVALNALRHYGVAQRIDAVRTTGYQAELAMGSVAPPKTSGSNVWVIQAIGNFRCMVCRGPGKAPAGRYVTIVTGGGLSGDAVANQPIDLARLGPVITLRP
jgi:hypothetical protein